MRVPAKLEAVTLLTTSNEIDRGDFEKFINGQLVNCYSTNLDLIIMINNSKHSRNIIPIITNILEKFKTIEINYIEIPREDDIYRNSTNNEKYIPELGLSSGPNILFFTAMRYCKKYSTILNLETDCILKPDCFQKLEKFVEYSGDFLIIGSSYSGAAIRHRFEETLFHHTNGVALYKTGDKEFHFLINEVERNIIIKVSKKDYRGSSYDYAITEFLRLKLNSYNDSQIETFFKEEKGIKSNLTTWKLIYKKILKTNLILDFSLANDRNTPVYQIEELYPEFVILHKKI